MQIASIGIDLGKTTFHLVALDHHSKVVIQKKFSRKQLLAYTANLPSVLIGIEACSGAHFIGAALRKQGHEVRLIPAQFVKPFLKSNKNDFLDAEAIAEAVARENMRFVPIKSNDQLDLQALHRVRDRLVHRRTALINQIRGFLLERGITFATGPANLRRQMPAILEDAEQNITPRMRSLLDHLWQEWKQLNSEIEQVSGEIDAIACQDAACQRLRQIPGVGPLVATATVAAIGNGAAFRRGREFEARRVTGTFGSGAHLLRPGVHCARPLLRILSGALYLAGLRPQLRRLPRQLAGAPYRAIWVRRYARSDIGSIFCLPHGTLLSPWDY